MPDIKNLGDYTYNQILEFLPSALEIAFASYCEFASKLEGEDAPSFKKHHDACKAAILHIELLLKLAKSADLQNKNHIEDISSQEQKNISKLLLNAQKELADK